MAWMRIALVLSVALFFSVAPALAADEAKSSGLMGQHEMTGQVTKVDHAKGMLTLKTGEGKMHLHFPPSALTNVKKGDRIIVELGLKENAPAASPATEKKHGLFHKK